MGVVPKEQAAVPRPEIHEGDPSLPNRLRLKLGWWRQHASRAVIDIPLATSTTVLSGLDFCAKCDFCVKGWVGGICRADLVVFVFFDDLMKV